MAFSTVSYSLGGPSVLPASIAVTSSSDKHVATWKDFNHVADDKIKEIKAIVFGPIIKILGMLGVAYGVCMLCMGQTKPIITYGGIGLLLNIIPYFIDSVFGALLP